MLALVFAVTRGRAILEALTNRVIKNLIEFAGNCAHLCDLTPKVTRRQPRNYDFRIRPIRRLGASLG